MITQRTLNSVSAKLLPKQILGPSENVRRFLCPEISLDLVSDISSHRSGSKSFAFGPQNTSERFMARMGDETIVPFATVRLCTISPVLVVIGDVNGITSSSAAYYVAVSSPFGAQTSEVYIPRVLSPRQGHGFEGFRERQHRGRVALKLAVPKWDQLQKIGIVLGVVSPASRVSSQAR